MTNYGTGWTRCTLSNGDTYWVNLATVMRMMRHRSAPVTLLTFVDHSTLDVTEEPEVLIQGAYPFAQRSST
jgi:hypothetical protein